MADLIWRVERWPIAGTFTIARGSKTEAIVVVAEISSDGFTGRAECVPYARYGETIDSVCAAIQSIKAQIELTPSRAVLQKLLPAGAARNALDCALWDLDAKSAGRRAWEIAGRGAPSPATTAFTLSLADPDMMLARAIEAAHRPLLKIKLGTPDDLPRLAAVRAGAPNAQIIIDANEGWSAGDLEKLLPHLVTQKVALIEQPLPAGSDAALKDLSSPIPICADESAHVTADIARLSRLYSAVNIKLDKAGGLTEALAMADAAKNAGMDIMVGCMVGTSLAMAPALLLCDGARYIDLDGPLLLAKDRPEGLKYDASVVHPPNVDLWG